MRVLKRRLLTRGITPELCTLRLKRRNIPKLFSFGLRFNSTFIIGSQHSMRAIFLQRQHNTAIYSHICVIRALLLWMSMRAYFQYSVSIFFMCAGKFPKGIMSCAWVSVLRTITFPSTASFLPITITYGV